MILEILSQSCLIFYFQDGKILKINLIMYEPALPYYLKDLIDYDAPFQNETW